MEKRGVSTVGQSTFSKWTAAKPVAKQKHFLVWAWHGALVASQLAQKPGGGAAAPGAYRLLRGRSGHRRCRRDSPRTTDSERFQM